MGDEFLDKLRNLESQFTKEYGDIKMLQANVAAINKLINTTGKSEKLYNALCSIINDFKEQESEQEKTKEA